MLIRALLFDFDGLILDTEFPIYEAWREDYLAHGHDLPLEVYAACVGSDFNRFDPKSHLESLVGRTIDWPDRDLWRERNALERVKQLPPLPGVVALLDAASSLGLPCAVASSSPRSWVEGHLGRLGLLHRFRLIRCIDDVAAPKPSPDLFLAAAAGLGVAPSEALALEDSRNGLLAAKAAGCPCIVVPNRVTAHLDFEGALMILASLEEIDLTSLIQ
ncbi:MAG: HAD-IA family hydrolase [Verrucomicrobiales bacterium]|nr:HAD-IA family hydrolase [Verrucomicrobiales bacterium]